MDTQTRLNPARASLPRKIVHRIATVFRLIGFFMARQRLFFAPLILVLLLAGLLLLASEGLSYVAPFVYTLF